MARRLEIAALAALLAATAVAYLPAIDGDFVFDDFTTIGSPAVRAPGEVSLERWLNDPRPLALATFAANHAAVGLDPRGWHLTNLAVHLAAVVLAWAFARRSLARAGLDRSAGPALAVAGLFALHPLQSESVAYVAQRSEALASGLMLAALLLLLARDGAAGPARRALLLLAAAAAQVLGLATKPIAATVPMLWLVHAAFLPSPGEEDLSPWVRIRRRLLAALPLFALSALAAWRGIGAAAGLPHAGFEIPGVPPAAYLATQLRVIPRYLGLVAWPDPLVLDREVPLSQGLGDPAALAWGAALLVTLGLAAWAGFKFGRARGPEVAPAARTLGFGACFFAVALAPSSSFIPLLDPMAEHRAYLPALGVFVAVVAAVTIAVRRVAGARAGVAGVALAAAVLLACGAATSRRAAAWANAIGLWSDTVRHSPGKSRVHLNLGFALASANRHEEAMASLRTGLRLSGDATASLASILMDMVDSLVALGRHEEAWAAVEQLAPPPAFDPLGPALLGRIALTRGDYVTAARWAREALALEPLFGPALRVLGMAQLRAGAPAVGLETLRLAASGNIVDPPLFLALGEAEARAGSAERACRALRTAAEQPGDPGTSDTARVQLAARGCPRG